MEIEPRIATSEPLILFIIFTSVSAVSNDCDKLVYHCREPESTDVLVKVRVTLYIYLTETKRKVEGRTVYSCTIIKDA